MVRPKASVTTTARRWVSVACVGPPFDGKDAEYGGVSPAVAQLDGVAEVAFIRHPEFVQDGCGGGISGVAGGVDAVHPVLETDVQQLSTDGGAQAMAPETGMGDVLNLSLGVREAADVELAHSYDLVVQESCVGEACLWFFMPCGCGFCHEGARLREGVGSPCLVPADLGEAGPGVDGFNVGGLKLSESGFGMGHDLNHDGGNG